MSPAKQNPEVPIKDYSGWSEQIFSLLTPKFNSKCTLKCGSAETVEDFLNLFLTENLVLFLVNCTNEKIREGANHIESLQRSQSLSEISPESRRKNYVTKR